MQRSSSPEADRPSIRGARLKAPTYKQMASINRAASASAFLRAAASGSSKKLRSPRASGSRASPRGSMRGEDFASGSGAAEQPVGGGAIAKPSAKYVSASRDTGPIGGGDPGTKGGGDLGTKGHALTALKDRLKGGVDSEFVSVNFDDLAPLPAYQPPEPEIRRGSAIQALRRALVDVQRDLQAVHGGSVELTDADLFNWEVALAGPPESPYRGGIFRFLFRFPADYPSGKVRVRCVTPIFHCNIDANGTVCLGDAGDSNGDQFTAACITRVLLSLLRLPQPEHALVHTAARLFERDRVAFDLAAHAWTLEHAI